MKANLNGRLARLEQQYSPQLMDPPEHMSIYVLAFGWESRCYIINQVGDDSEIPKLDTLVTKSGQTIPRGNAKPPAKEL